jgi:hypothetical protein
MKFKGEQITGVRREFLFVALSAAQMSGKVRKRSTPTHGAGGEAHC